MQKINRRKFLRSTGKMAAGLAGGVLTSRIFAATSGEIRIEIPMPIQVVIDDVGWWNGTDGHTQQEPYRTGIYRNHVPADYQAIVDLGKALNIRPQAAMILCEWDKENILKKLPTSTWMDTRWDNSRWIGPWLEEAADIIRMNREHFELTLHGVGHEYWTDGKFTRAEWADSNGIMRPHDQVEAHLDFFDQLMNQHQLGPFPTSFVPTAFLHSVGRTAGHDISMAEILKARGVYYINSPFEDMFNADKFRQAFFGFDYGVMTVDRGRDLLSWKTIGEAPTGELKGPTCGLHWPNLLHPEPEQNNEIVQSWVELLKPYQHQMGTLLAADSDIFLQQLAYHECTQQVLMNSRVQLDFTNLGDFPREIIGNRFYIKISAAKPLECRSDQLQIMTAQVEKRDKEAIQYRLELKRLSEAPIAYLEFNV